MSAITRQTTSEHVVREIRRQIWTGELRGGDRLAQEDLAAAMRVSRIPIREALILLAGEGAIRMTPHRGAFVEPLTEAGVADHYELFGHVDGFALRRAIERAAPVALAALSGDMVSAGSVDLPNPMQHLVIGTRARIHELGGSARFQAVARGLIGLVPGNFFEEVPGALEVARRRLPDAGIAIGGGDTDRAVEAYDSMMREHGVLVRDVLRRRGVLA
ncbi:MAG: GntR family transcriptional regulator [Acidimicrobiales bacterium]